MVCLHFLHFKFENGEMDEKWIFVYIFIQNKNTWTGWILPIWPINLKRKSTNSIDKIGYNYKSIQLSWDGWKLQAKHVKTRICTRKIKFLEKNILQWHLRWPILPINIKISIYVEFWLGWKWFSGDHLI